MSNQLADILKAYSDQIEECSALKSKISLKQAEISEKEKQLQHLEQVKIEAKGNLESNKMKIAELTESKRLSQQKLDLIKHNKDCLYEKLLTAEVSAAAKTADIHNAREAHTKLIENQIDKYFEIRESIVTECKK